MLIDKIVEVIDKIVKVIDKIVLVVKLKLKNKQNDLIP